MKNIPKPLMFTVAFGVALGLFQFWPFALIFFILGGIATIVVGAIIGQEVNYFLVLFIEYLLMALAVFFALLYVQRRLKK